MSLLRNRKEDLQYKAYLKTVPKDHCVFCNIDKNSKQFISETKYSKIITNIFPYSLWENMVVEEQLMITPIRHVSSLSDLDKDEALDYMKLLQKYEGQGYNIYGRAPSSPTKSIPHQHMHLIKTKGNQKHLVISSQTPKLRIAV